MIEDLDNINKIIQKEKLELCVICYGGCCSNHVVKILQQQKYNCITPIWRKILCHCPKYIDINIQIIYLYDNPIKSFLSMKRRGYGCWNVNQQKLSNNKDIKLSDENLLQLMIKQFYNFTDKKHENILIINVKELFVSNICDKLSNFLKNKIEGFPLKYIEPKTKIENMTESDKLLFEKYKSDIDYINNF